MIYKQRTLIYKYSYEVNLSLNRSQANRLINLTYSGSTIHYYDY